MMIRVGIIGATGYAGAELVRILSGHPEVTLSKITSRKFAGVKFSDVFPAMSGVVDNVCAEYEVEAFADQVDVAFMALPHQLPMEFVPKLLERGIKVIDLSADFRFNNVATYESVYQPHTAGVLCRDSVYGLSEVNFDAIKKTRLVGNPGCYPTSVLLPLVPLLQNRLINHQSIIADSKSGVSGAGRSLSLTTHFCEVNESFNAYKVGVHRHTPEMEETLGIAAGKPVQLTFVPHLVPVTRGMLSTIYADIKEKVNIADIRECLMSYYNGRFFVRIYPENRFPDISHVRGTNYIDIGLTGIEKANRVVLISAIDNLVKGAAGQAVQNMNIMLGMDETTGLTQLPYPV